MQLPGAASYQAALNSHFFSLVILDFGDTAATDSQITADMRHAGGYHVVARTGRYTVWAAAAAGGGTGQPGGTWPSTRALGR